MKRKRIVATGNKTIIKIALMAIGAACIWIGVDTHVSMQAFQE